MEIRHMQTFIAIVELGGFTKASEHLGYAQSTITSHIKILEEELGEVLFDRLGKKIILTSVGRALLPYAKDMIRLYKEIKNIKSDENNVSGDLSIGASESLSIYRLGKIFKEYKEKFPNVNLIIKNDTCSRLRNSLYEGEIDIIFTIETEVTDKDLIVNKLKDESMVIIGAKNLDLNFIVASGENKFPKQSILLTEKGCRARASFKRYLMDKDIKSINNLEFSSIEVIKNYTINGLGVSFLPLYIVENEIEKGLIKSIEIEDSYNNFKTQLIYHKSKNISIAMKKLIEITLNNSSKW